MLGANPALRWTIMPYDRLVKYKVNKENSVENYAYAFTYDVA